MFKLWIATTMLLGFQIEAVASINLDSQISIVPGQVNQISFPASIFVPLMAKSVGPFAIKVICSPGFIAGFTILSPHSELCQKPTITLSSLADLAKISQTIDVLPEKALLKDTRITFAFFDQNDKGDQPAISVTHKMRFYSKVPIEILNPHLSLSLSRNWTNDIAIACVQPDYIARVSETRLTANFSPPMKWLNHRFVNGTLYVSLQAVPFGSQHLLTYTIEDSAAKLSSDNASLQLSLSVTPFTKSNPLNYELSVLLVLGLTSVLIFMALVALHIINKQEEAGFNGPDSSVQAAPFSDSQRQAHIINTSESLSSGGAMLTDSIVKWNQQLVKHHISKSLSTFDASQIEQSNSSISPAVFYGRFDQSDEQVLSNLNLTIADGEELSMICNEKKSVLSQPGPRKSQFL